MKKIVLVLFFVLFTKCCVASSANDNDIDFFLAKKFFKNKAYAKSEFFFNKVIEDNLYTNSEVKKSRLYLILLKIKLGQFEEVASYANNFMFIYDGSADKMCDYASFFHSLASYNLTKDIFQVLLFFDKDKYNKTLMKKALFYIENIKDVNVLPVNILEIIDKLQEKRKKHDILLIEHYLQKKAYLAAIDRILELDCDFNRVLDKKLLFLLLKTYNELYLDTYSKFILDNFKKVVNSGLDTNKK